MSASDITQAVRFLEPYFHIDPGFINKRLCISTLGDNFKIVEPQLKLEKDHWCELYNHHLMVNSILQLCKDNDILPYQSIICRGNIEIGMLWSSIETLKGVKNIYDKKNAKNRIITPTKQLKKSYLTFNTEHFVAETGKVEQSEKRRVSIIAKIDKITPYKIISRPLIMGAPTFDYILNPKELISKLLFSEFDFYELMPEDIHEFKELVKIEVTPEEWMPIMKEMSEDRIKRTFCELLNDIPQKDWGGETDDHFSTSITVDGKRKTCGFIFKGKAKFKPMTPDVLGKNGDQIYRLSQSPAQILIVQHCHNIEESVRATLQRFAVTPHNPRKFCLIDGKDTYRIFKAYGKL